MGSRVPLVVNVAAGGGGGGPQPSRPAQPSWATMAARRAAYALLLPAALSAAAPSLLSTPPGRALFGAALSTRGDPVDVTHLSLSWWARHQEIAVKQRGQARGVPSAAWGDSLERPP